jgi:hypothetical protein
MTPRVFEILARLESLSREAFALHKELQEIQDTESGNMPLPDFSMFRGQTIILLLEFWNAPNHAFRMKTFG